MLTKICSTMGCKITTFNSNHQYCDECLTTKLGGKTSGEADCCQPNAIIIFAGKKYCSNHMCSIKKCLRFKKSSEAYCSQHNHYKCHLCEDLSEVDSYFCNIHKCFLPTCSGEKDVGSIYCKKHTCSFSINNKNCRSLTTKGKYCFGHACQTKKCHKIVCNNIRGGIWNSCFEHCKKCTICFKIIETQYTYCLDHTCKNCNGQKTIGSAIACRLCLCLTTGCKELKAHRGFEEGYCQKCLDKHCGIEGCHKNSIDGHPMCKSHLIEYSFTNKNFLKIPTGVKESPNAIICKICFEQKIDTILTCGHTICRKCIEEWLKSNNTCPMCRQFIRSELKPLFVE